MTGTAGAGPRRADETAGTSAGRPKTFGIGTRIVTGLGVSGELGALVAPFARRWAVIADRGLANAGLLEPILASVAPGAIGTTCLIDVNPDLAAATRAADASAAAGCDGVLAVGGGSALCAAKAAAILLTNPGPIERYEGVGRVGSPPAPIVAVPTTAGSGSEVSNALVLHDAGRPAEVVVRGPGCEPDLAVLDGALLRSLPPRPMVEAALDALAHALEARWVHGRTLFSDAMALKAAEEICRWLPVALEDRDDGALQTLLEASCAANLACGSAGLGLVHALTTSPQVRLPHGYQNGALLLHVAEFNEPFLDGATSRLVEAATALYERIAYAKRFQPTDTTADERAALLAAARGHVFRANNVRPSTDEDLHRLLDQAGVASATTP